MNTHSDPDLPRTAISRTKKLVARINAFLIHNKPGMRVIKTFLAILICLTIDFLRQGPYPYQSSIAALVCMQPDIKSTLKIAGDRTLGTLIAGLYAFAFVLLFKERLDIPTSSFHFYLLTGLFTLPLMTIMLWVKKPSALVITAVVYLVITLTASGRDPLYAASQRVLDTLIGIVVTLLVNWLPPLNRIAQNSQNKAI